MAEAAWLGPKSLGSVLYGRVSNVGEGDESRRLTVTSVKAAAFMSLAVLVVVIVLPDRLYQLLFGPEITGITRLVLLLSPGIIAMAVSQALSHFYSGTGRNHHNLIGSGLGVLATLAFGFWLIPTHGIQGAAIAASIAYSVNAIYQLIVFQRITGTSIGAYMPDAGDRERLMRLVKLIH